MPQQIALHVETLAAELARVWPLSGVRPLVDQHRSVGGKLLIAHGAHLERRTVLTGQFGGAGVTGGEADPAVGLTKLELGVRVLDVVDPLGGCREVLLA